MIIIIFNSMLESLNGWSEAIITVIMATVLFIVAFTRLSDTVKSNKQISDDRWDIAKKEIDALKETSDDTNDSLNNINVTLKGLSIDVDYIKKSIDKIEHKLES